MKPRWMGGLLLALLVAASNAQAGQASGPALGARVADAIRAYAKFSIFDDVDIAIDSRNVTLIGRVTSPQKKEEIEQLVARIEGVGSVRNDIGVLPVSPTDQRLRNTVASAIYRHPAFWQYAQVANPPIHVIIENQHITLVGEVGSELDSTLAYSLAQVPGAISITNKIRVAGRGSGRSAPAGRAEQKLPGGRN